MSVPSSRNARGPARRHWPAQLALTVLLCLAPHGAEAAAVADAPTLVVDNSFAVDTLDPQRAFDPTSSIADRAIYDTLFTYRGNDLAHPTPLLVSSWVAKDNARSFTFHLKRNVHFADGTPLTSADVVFSLRRLVNHNGNPSFLLQGVTVTPLGRFGVGMRSATPDPQLPSILANPSTGIVNSTLVKAHGGTDTANASSADKAESWLNSSASLGAGSGPFVLSSFSATSQITMTPNANRWGTKKPPFASVVVRNMVAPTQLINIQRGSHEIAIDLSAGQAKTLQRKKNLKVSFEPSAGVFYLVTNDDPHISPVTSNKLFQEALRYAIDYEALRAVAGPGAIQAPGMIPSMILGALSQKQALRQNLVRARAALAASGVGNERLALEYPSDLTINGLPFAIVAQKLQVDLRTAGFDIAIAGSPVSVFEPKFRANKVALGLWVWTPDFADPADYLVFAPGHLVALHAGWPTGSDLKTEQLAANASAATDPAARASLYRQFQLALNTRSPFIPLIQPTQVFAATKDLANAVSNDIYDVDVTQISPK